MCTFFHATNKIFNVEEYFSINMFDGDSTYDHNNRSDREKEINIKLDRCRPEGVLSRTKCIYLFGNISHCMHYAKSMKYSHVYAVHSLDNVFGPFPMVLVNSLYNSPPQVQQSIIHEYWNPTHDWIFNEFIASSFVVDEEIPICRFIFNIDYCNDRELASKSFSI